MVIGNPHNQPANTACYRPPFTDQGRLPRTRLEPAGPTPAFSLRQILVQFPLVEEPLLGFERAGHNDPNRLAVRPIYTKDSDAACRHAQVKKPGLDRKP